MGGLKIISVQNFENMPILQVQSATNLEVIQDKIYTSKSSYYLKIVSIVKKKKKKSQVKRWSQNF